MSMKKTASSRAAGHPPPNNTGSSSLKLPRPSARSSNNSQLKKWRKPNPKSSPGSRNSGLAKNSTCRWKSSSAPAYAPPNNSVDFQIGDHFQQPQQGGGFAWRDLFPQLVLGCP